MRLLDLVAQSNDPFVILPQTDGAKPMTVSGPSDFASTIKQCPLRFVIGDDLTRASAELAFADGDRLASCLTQNSGAALVGRVERRGTSAGDLRMRRMATQRSQCRRPDGGSVVAVDAAGALCNGSDLLERFDG